MSIETKNLSFSYSGACILKNIDFKVSDGETVAFLGPNGAGKTTFFRCLLGFLKPSEGSVSVNGKDISFFSRKELAGQLAYIPQSYSPAFNHTVIDSVLMGLTAQLGVFESPSKHSIEKAMGVLENLGIADLANRGSMKISGGERQLMLLARALVQDARILIMDEPTSNLDFGNSYRVMERIARLKEQGYTVLFSTHDPSQALRWATRVVAFHDHSKLIDGGPEVLTDRIIDKLYGVKVSVCNLCNSVIIEK